MTLLVLLLLILLLAGAGGFGAWRAPTYRSEWIGLCGLLIALLLIFYAMSGWHYTTPPVIR